MTGMSQAATASRLAIHASISSFACPPRRLTASGIGMLSTTDQTSGGRPAGVVSISDFRSATSASVHALPIGTSCNEDTIFVAPAWRTSSRVTGALGPNHLQPCLILSLSPVSAEIVRVTSGEFRHIGNYGAQMMKHCLARRGQILCCDGVPDRHMLVDNLMHAAKYGHRQTPRTVNLDFHSAQERPDAGIARKLCNRPV